LTVLNPFKVYGEQAITRSTELKDFKINNKALDRKQIYDFWIKEDLLDFDKWNLDKFCTDLYSRSSVHLHAIKGLKLTILEDATDEEIAEDIYEFCGGWLPSMHEFLSKIKRTDLYPLINKLLLTDCSSFLIMLDLTKKLICKYSNPNTNPLRDL
jgi:hypothetical protein